ncbi:non-specific lipid transfer protein GPI-anchored 15 [Ricinus communis]|uniref:Nonspecific lipid-transfer protein, putative n=1 Tax=Ricinus communis TaxID=3988 RepID=B9SFI7_RICCO|nr:non-specific lipid transfer protein GPI-anchored 15 [Ricinus communis]EEF37599.1 Nonspecific lipid-transfer protein precursor, putative [Ricinus communis]|eukprot:XP_002524756.1 non-specific lipid-transfer protein-like protein At2g13820 [Ricinus communis]
MASSRIRIGLVLVLVTMIYGGAMAQSGCNSVVTNLASCLNYITGNSSTPSASCCSNLANVVQSSPQCLCSLLNNSGPSLGITINQTLALSLPGACKVQTPPISQCKAATAPTISAAPPTSAASPTTSVTPPVSSPTNSPPGSSNETPEPAITPSASNVPPSSGTGAGSKTIPSTTDGTSDGSIIKAPLHFMLLAFFLLWSGSTITKF